MKLKAPIFRDGTSQRTRSLAALAPTYVAVDEQTVEDSLGFVQAFAKQLRYFNLNNQPEGDWAAFFEGDVQRILAYFESPDSFVPASDEELAWLSSPHLSLLLSFLNLYQYPQQQFKDLTGRYLDFYYRNVLRLSEKAATPDQVNVVFGLRDRTDIHHLEKGALLSAGPDSAGIEQQYVLEDDIYLNKAQIASVKTLAVEKINVDLKVIHQQDERSQLAFENVLRWAIGTPAQGDALPNFPAGRPNDAPYEITDINRLFESIKTYTLADITVEQQQYILEQLCFATIDDFKTCLSVHSREIGIQQGESETIAPTDAEWDAVYALIERAYRKKINRDRRLILKAEHRNPDYDSTDAAFLGMVQLALGDAYGEPVPTDPLPAMPGTNSLNDLFVAVSQTDADAVQYVKEQLYMTVEDFQTVMETKQRLGDDLDAIGWSEVYRLLEKAQSKKREFTYPPIGQLEIRGITAAGVTDDTQSESGQPVALQRFNTFSPNLPDPALPTSAPQSIGVAVSSPVLIMAEGTREITVTLACDPDGFDQPFLSQLIEQGDNPFEIAISTEADWLLLPQADLHIRAGDFVLETPLKDYALSEIQPVYQSIEDEPFVDSQQGSDVGKYLHLKDGSLYEIVEARSGSTVRLQQVEAMLPARDQVAKYNTLALTGSYSEIHSPDYNEAEQSISTPADSFSTADVDQFIMLANGTIYRIVRYANARKVEVSFWGYLPGDGRNKKYEQINLTSLGNLAELEMVSIAIPAASNHRFSSEAVGHCLVWNTGFVYRITALTSDREAQVNRIGQLDRSPEQATTIFEYARLRAYTSAACSFALR